MIDAPVPEDHWTTFERAQHTLGETPGLRESWHRGRSTFSVWILRIEHAEVTARARACAALLERFITPQPPADLHVTVWVAGFAATTPKYEDDVPWSALETQRAALESAVTCAALQIGGVCSFLSVPFLSVRDGDGLLHALRSALAPHARELRFAPYVPHVTLGKYHGAHETRDIAAALTPLRSLPPIEVPIRCVELVDVHTFVDAPLATRWRIELAD